MLRFLLLVLLGVAFVGAVSERRVVAQDHDPHEHAHDEAGHMHDEDQAQAEVDDEWSPPRQSMLMWTFRSLGWRYSLALPLAGLVAFALALILVIRGGSNAGSALLFVVPIPLLVGMFGFLDGMIAGFQVIATPGHAPRPWELAEGISTALLTPVVGMLLMAPAYLVAMGGLFIRTITEPRPPRKP